MIQDGTFYILAPLPAQRCNFFTPKSCQFHLSTSVSRFSRETWEALMKLPAVYYRLRDGASRWWDEFMTNWKGACKMRMKTGWRKWIGHGHLNFQVGFLPWNLCSGPEHRPSQKESSLPITIFAMAMLVVRECNHLGVAINPRVTKLHHEGMTGS